MIDRGGWWARRDRMAMRVGTLAGTRKGVYLQHRDGLLVHGPTGAGKTWRLAWHLVMNAPGSVLVTTTKADLVSSTWLHRSCVGPVWIFDPENLIGWPGSIRWSPLTGCEDPSTAIRRAQGLTASLPIEGTKNGGYFESKATTLLRCYLHAAALGGYGIRDVRGWVKSRTATTPRAILESSSVPDWGEDDLAPIVESRSDSSSDVINSAARLLEPLADPLLRNAVDVNPKDGFDPARFLSEPSTVYLVSKGTSGSMVPFVAALADEVYHVADRMTQRHDPPVRFVLDEMNNVAPLPHLPKKLTDSGGRGITLVGFAHSQAQNIERWGAVGGRQLAASAPVRLILPGINDIEELDALSRLIGKQRRWVKTPNGGTLVEDYRIPPDRIRTLPAGHGLLLYRNAPPIMLRMPSVWEQRGPKRLVLESQKAFGKVLNPAAEFEPV